MIVGIAVETTVVSKEASAVTRTSAAVTARRLFGSKRGALVSREAMGATAYSTAPASGGLSGVDFDVNARGRDRDRAEEGSTALEGFNELPGLVLRYAGHLEAEANGVEDGVVGARGVGEVHLAGDLDADARDRESLFLRDDGDELHGAGGDAGEERFRRCDGFAGAAVLDRTVYDEMLGAAGAEDAAEGVGGAGGDFVAADGGRGHAAPPARGYSLAGLHGGIQRCDHGSSPGSRPGGWGSLLPARSARVRRPAADRAQEPPALLRRPNDRHDRARARGVLEARGPDPGGLPGPLAFLRRRGAGDAPDPRG